MDIRQRAEPRDDARQKQHRQVRLVLADTRVALRNELVLGRGETHHALAMDDARSIDVAPRQDETELGLKSVRGFVRRPGHGRAWGNHGHLPHTRSIASVTIVAVSGSTSLAPALSVPTSSFETHAPLKL